MKLNVFQKVSVALMAGLLGSAVQAQTTTSTLTGEQELAINLAAGLYPELFSNGGAVKSAQGYTYQTFASGVSVGFKDGALYLAGGPFGSAIQNKGSISQVIDALVTLKHNVEVMPTEEMDNLFHLAAAAYPTMFHGGTPIQTSADGYVYSYFAGSGLYAAIKNGTVYVKGGQYGTTYRSIGSLSSVLTTLDKAVHGGGTGSVSNGEYDLTVTGTYSIGSFTGPVPAFTITDIPAPSVASEDQVRAAFINFLQGSGPNATIHSFTYTVKSNTADLVEFDMSVSATITSGPYSTNYSYALNYRYVK